MRILHVDEGTEHRGGQAQVALLLADPESAVLTTPGGSLWNATARRFPFGLRGLFQAIRRFRPDVVAAHTSRAHDLALLQPRPVVVHRRVDFRRRSPKYRAVHGFIAVSRAVRDVLIEGGVDPARIHVVHDALVPLRPGRRLPDVPPGLVLAAGAGVAHKDHPTLARACAIAGLPLWIAGPTSCQAPGIALGWRDDVPDLLASAAVFAHPSVEEGFGSVLLQARAAGVPIVATRAGGVPEAAGPDAVLVPPGDVQALARALRTRVDTGPETLPAHTAASVLARTREAYHHLVAV